MGESPFSDEILVLRNFGTETDVAALLAAFHAAIASTSRAVIRRPHRTEVVCRNMADVWDYEVLERVTKVREHVIAAMRRAFDIPMHLPDFTLLSEMRVGDSHVLHADGERHTGDGWQPNHTPWRTHVGLLYLNTSGVDYQGGLLRLPTIARTIEPTTGAFVAFPSGRRHVHEVTTIEAGQRLSLSVWLTGDPSYVEAWPLGAVRDGDIET